MKPWTLTAILVLLVFLSGCQTQGDDPFKADSLALNEFKRIQSVQVPTLTDLDSLKRLHAQYPQANEIRQTLQTALQARQEWEALAGLINEKPESELNQADKLNLARIYIKLGKYNDASHILRPLADSAPNDLEINTLAGHAWYYDGKYEDAARVFDRVWSDIVTARQVDSINMRAMICFYQGDQTRAIELLKKAIEIKPDYIPANNGLSRVYAARGDKEQAEFYRNQAERAHAAQTELEIRQMRLTSRARDLEQSFKGANYDECVSIANEMIPAANNSLTPMLYEYLGRCYQALGKQTEAQSALATAARLRQQSK